MKPPKNVASLAEALTASMTTPALTIAKETTPAPRKSGKAAVLVEPPAKASAKGSTSVFLRVPNALFETLQQEATERTKATGKGVTVQQVILAKLGEVGA